LSQKEKEIEEKGGEEKHTGEMKEMTADKANE